MNFLEFITNPFVLFLISVPTFTFIGIVVGTWLSQPRKERVLKVIPESGRGEELEVDHSDTINAYCNPIGNIPPQRFIKRFQAINVVRKGLFQLQTYALWIGRRGTAYTFNIGQGNENVKVSFRDAVYNVFGKDLYEKIPNNEKTGFIKDQIEASSVDVMIEFPDSPLTPLNPGWKEGDPIETKYLPSITSDDVRKNNKEVLVEAIVRGVNKLSRGDTSGQILKIIFPVIAGVGIGVILSLIFKWGAPVVYQNSPQTPVNGTGG